MSFLRRVRDRFTVPHRDQKAKWGRSPARFRTPTVSSWVGARPVQGMAKPLGTVSSCTKGEPEGRTLRGALCSRWGFIPPSIRAHPLQKGEEPCPGFVLPDGRYASSEGALPSPALWMPLVARFFAPCLLRFPLVARVLAPCR